MKSWSKGMLAAAIALPTLSGVARADDFGCSNATLQGDYAFSVLSLLPQNVVVGIGTFDGKGGFTQIDYPGDRLRTDGTLAFRTGQTGSYLVNPDCTGSQEIDLNVPMSRSGPRTGSSTTPLSSAMAADPFMALSPKSLRRERRARRRA
jgi:hypothetical protein